MLFYTLNSPFTLEALENPCYQERMKLQGNQIRAARGLLGWERSDLARESGVGLNTLAKIESGKTEHANTRTYSALITTFIKHGVVFTPTGGVEPVRPELRTYSGREGFHLFFDDVYETIKEQGGEVMITGVVDEKFIQAIDDEDYKEKHIARMSALNNYQMKSLVEEGITDFVSGDYSEYRWSPRKTFSPVPFYIYGDKIAFIQFDAPIDAPFVVVIHSKLFSDAFRMQFNGMWDDAKIPS